MCVTIELVPVLNCNRVESNTESIKKPLLPNKCLDSKWPTIYHPKTSLAHVFTLFVALIIAEDSNLNGILR